MIFVLKMFFRFVHDRKNENVWQLLFVTHYSEYKHPKILILILRLFVI